MLFIFGGEIVIPEINQSVYPSPIRNRAKPKLGALLAELSGPNIVSRFTGPTPFSCRGRVSRLWPVAIGH